VTSAWRQKPSDFYDFWCMKSWGTLTAEDYKFAHLTCILWPHKLEKCKKKSFSTMLFIRASEYLGYFRIKWITTVTMQLSGSTSLLTESVRSDLPLRGHKTQLIWSVTPLFDRLTHDVPPEFSPCLNQQLPQLDHNQHSGYTLMHHAQDALIHNLNLGHDGWPLVMGLKN